MSKIYSYIVLTILSVFTLTSCGPFKYKPVDAREVSPNPDERVKKNIEEGKGFRLQGKLKKGGTFDFASSNPLWQSTLEVLDFMPLVSANYSGGIVITDWYSENSSKGEAIKISVRFLSNDIRADAIDVKVFLKQCDQNLNCIVSENKGKLTNELMASILKKAARYEKDGLENNKKKNPYRNIELGTED